MEDVDFDLLSQQLKALTEDVPYETANLANASALLWQTLPRINWAGFYKMTEGRLVLGPFQGKPACICIPLGRGVCGTAAQTEQTVVVADVRRFPGHIACDGASRSEIVVPVHKDGRIWGVLDIDSPETDRFDTADQKGLENFVRVLERAL